MRKLAVASLLLFFSVCLNAQYGSIAVFETGPDQKVSIVRIFPVKCAVTKMDDSAYRRINESVNQYMNLDGKMVYTKFYIPYTGYEGAKKFALDEYIPKSDARKVKFIEEAEEILLDQTGSVVSSKNKEKPLGSIIAYFHNGTEIYQWAVCEVWGKSLTRTPGDLARECGGTGERGGLLISEWKPGLDWDAAANVARKNSSRYALPGMYHWIALDDYGRNQVSLKQTGYTEKEMELIRQGKRPDGEKIDYSKEDYIDNLPPATINKLKSYFKEEQDKLLAQGWVRFSSRYDYAPYQYDQFSFSGRMDRSYTIILVADDTSALAHVSEKGNELARQKLGPGKFMVYYDLHSPTESRHFSAYVESLNQKKIAFGVIGFRKEPRFPADFQGLLFDAQMGFGLYRGGFLKSENGKDIYLGKKTLGQLQAEVSFNSTLGKWEYTVYTVWGDKDADQLDLQLDKFIGEREKLGAFIIRKRESADKNTLYTDVFDKYGNLLFAAEKQKDWTKKDKWTFYEQSPKPAQR